MFPLPAGDPVDLLYPPREVASCARAPVTAPWLSWVLSSSTVNRSIKLSEWQRPERASWGFRGGALLLGGVCGWLKPVERALGHRTTSLLSTAPYMEKRLLWCGGVPAPQY